MSNPLATSRQLWRLNKDGRLAVRLSEGELAYGITSELADRLIKAGPLGSASAPDPFGVGTSAAQDES